MTTPTTSGPHQWQQPITPLEYSVPNPSSPESGPLTYHPFWYRVIFIRPTDDGYQVMGQHGAIWDARAIVVRVAST